MTIRSLDSAKVAFRSAKEVFPLLRSWSERRRPRKSLVVGVLLLLALQVPATAEDWPGWMGGHRDGVYRESGIIDRIPDSGLRVKWRTPIGGGYAGPAVANGKVILFDYKTSDGESFNDPGRRARLQGQERVIALDEKTGKVLWIHSYDCPYSISYPAGPRCTPTIDGQYVYTLGSEGDLRCLRLDEGSLVWKRQFKTDFGASVPIWGFTSHPLVVGDLLFTLVGGDGQVIMAFDKRTGEVRWKSLDGNPGYCPPTIIQAGGTQQLIVFYPQGVVGMNPENGNVYWRVPIAPEYDMSIAPPMIDGDRMFLSAIHTEALMLQLDTAKPRVKELWRGEGRKDAIHSANSAPIFVDGVVYGTDCDRGSLIAVDAKDGSRIWETFAATKPGEKRFLKHGTAFVTRIGNSDRYLILSETGDLIMARLSRDGYGPLGRFHLLEPTGECFGRSVLWSHPAYANQTIYARNDHEVVAASLAN